MKPRKGMVIISLLLIQVLSLATIWSTAPELFLSQFAFFIASVIIVLVLSRSDLNLIFSISGSFYIISILLLLLTMVVGQDIRGSVRWINLGFFNLQTSELVKALLAVYYSEYLAKHKLHSLKEFLIFLAMIMVPVVIVARQPDLGTAITLFILPVMLLIYTGHFKRLFIISLISLAILLPVGHKLLKPYQLQRLDSFLNPYKDPKRSGYNVIQAQIAIGSGGLFGKGVRLGTQSQLYYLPERHTDFIFASFAEEFGLIGITVLLTAYYLLFSRFLKISAFLKQKNYSLLSLSVFTVFFFQAIVNIGMNLGVMPVTGITLPIFSYGGSSLLSFAIMVGMELRLLDLVTPFEI